MAIKCSTNWATATYGISGARAGPALSSVTTPEIGGDIQNRTEDERLQSSRFTIKLYRHMERVMGHDPTTRGLEGRYSSQLSYTRI